MGFVGRVVCAGILIITQGHLQWWMQYIDKVVESKFYKFILIHMVDVDLWVEITVFVFWTHALCFFVPKVCSRVLHSPNDLLFPCSV